MCKMLANDLTADPGLLSDDHAALVGGDNWKSVDADFVDQPDWAWRLAVKLAEKDKVVVK